MLPEFEGYAIPVADILSDQLVECSSSDDPEASDDPATWPAWTSYFRWALGPGDPAADALADLRYTAACLGDDSPPIRCAVIEAACDILERALAAARNDPPEDLGHGGFGHHGCEHELTDGEEVLR